MLVRSTVLTLCSLFGAAVVMESPIPSPLVAEQEEEGEPSGGGCDQSWDFSKGEKKSHSSQTSRFGWENVDENYNIAYAHHAWGGKHTFDITAHVAC